KPALAAQSGHRSPGRDLAAGWRGVEHSRQRRGTRRVERRQFDLGHRADPRWARTVGRQRPLFGAQRGWYQAARVRRSQFLRAQSRAEHGGDSEADRAIHNCSIRKPFFLSNSTRPSLPTRCAMPITTNTFFSPRNNSSILGSQTRLRSVRNFLWMAGYFRVISSNNGSIFDALPLFQASMTSAKIFGNRSASSSMDFKNNSLSSVDRSANRLIWKSTVFNPRISFLSLLACE